VVDGARGMTLKSRATPKSREDIDGDEIVAGTNGHTAPISTKPEYPRRRHMAAMHRQPRSDVRAEVMGLHHNQGLSTPFPCRRSRCVPFVGDTTHDRIPFEIMRGWGSVAVQLLSVHGHQAGPLACVRWT